MGRGFGRTSRLQGDPSSPLQNLSAPGEYDY